MILSSNNRTVITIRNGTVRRLSLSIILNIDFDIDWWIPSPLTVKWYAVLSRTCQPSYILHLTGGRGDVQENIEMSVLESKDLRFR